MSSRLRQSGSAWEWPRLPALGDGGTLRFSGRRGDRSITVFTAPALLSAGPVDLSVLVLDAETGKPITDLPIEVQAQLVGRAGISNPRGGHDRSGHEQAVACGEARAGRARPMAFEVSVAGVDSIAADRIRCRGCSCRRHPGCR